MTDRMCDLAQQKYDARQDKFRAEQIADHLVEMGILTIVCRGRYTLPNVVTLDEDEILTDWRVAGKCLEAIDSGSIVNCDDVQFGVWSVLFNGKQVMGNNLPQAICEAYCKVIDQ